MKRKIRYLTAVITLGLLAFMSQASRAPLPILQATETPGPKARAALALEAQAGKSDGIVFLAILIFFFILIPILLRYRKMKSLQESSG
jgi:hypothetical protein